MIVRHSHHLSRTSSFLNKISTDTLGDQLRDCTSNDLVEGKRLHCKIIECGYEKDTYLSNLLVKMYGNCGCLHEAWSVFANMQSRNVISWNTLLQMFVHNGNLQQAEEAFERIPQTTVFSWNSAMAAFSKSGDFFQAQHLFIKSPCRNVVSWTTLVSVLAGNGYLLDAESLCNLMPVWNVVTFTVMLGVHSQKGQLESLRMLFEVMPERSSVTWNVLISESVVDRSKLFFDRMPCWDVVSWNSMLQAFAQHSLVDEARTLFSCIPFRNVVSWNSMITAYGANGFINDAKAVFDEMPRRDRLSWIAIIKACSAVNQSRLLNAAFDKISQRCSNTSNIVLQSCLRGGEFDVAWNTFCDEIPHRDHHLWMTMVAGLASFSDDQISTQTYSDLVDQAERCFTRMPLWDTLSWNAIIAAHTRLGDASRAKNLFDKMKGRDVLSWTSLIAASSAEQHLLQACETFEKLPARDVYSWNTILVAVLRDSKLSQAWKIFRSMPERDVVTWNTMVAACAQHGWGDDSLRLFCEMDLEGSRPDEISCVSFIDACSSDHNLLAAGRALHTIIKEEGFLSHTKVANALLNMYSKHGYVDEAEDVFLRGYQSSARNEISWSTMLSAYAGVGLSNRASHLMHLMRLEGVGVDGVTLVSVLSWCSQTGDVVGSVREFTGAVSDFGVRPSVDHYLCVMDVFGRVGQTEAAEELLRCMPFYPNAMAWHTILACCKSQMDPDRGWAACLGALGLEPDASAPYVLMAQICENN